MSFPSLSFPSQGLRVIALGGALLGIACASILLVIAEADVSPYAATFDRLSLAAVIFLVWQMSQPIKRFLSEALRNGDLTSNREPRDDRGEGPFSPTPFIRSLKAALLPSDLTRSDAGLLLLSGLAFSGSLSLWAWSLTQTSVANSTLLNNMMPIFTTLGAWLLFRETFSRKFLLGMGIAIAGVIAIGLEDLQVTDGFVGDEAALGAAILSAVNILSVERLRSRFDTPWIMMWTSSIGSGFLAILLLSLGDSFFPSTPAAWAAVIALACVSQALGQGLLTYCLKAFSAGLVAVSMLMIPVIAAGLALVLFGEQLSILNWLAFSVVLLGIYVSVSSQLQDDNAVQGTSANAVLLEEG